MRFSNFGLFKLYTGALLFASVSLGAHASTTVVDRSQFELASLKQAIESIFKTQCSAIKATSGGSYSLELAGCLPAKIVRVMGKSASIGGPNCYNFALYAMGVLDSLRPINSSEVEDLYLTDKSSICSKATQGKPQPGDVISLEQRHSGNEARKIHAYVYLTQKYALTKNGPETDSKWEVSSLPTIFSTYPVAKEEKIQVRYVCKRPADVVPEGLKASIEAISRFSKFLSDMQLEPNISSISANQVKGEISALSKILSISNLQRLSENSSNPVVRSKLYELVSHLYSIKIYYYRLTEISEVKGKALRPYAEMYLEILDRLLNVSESDFGVEDVSNSDDGLEYSYCEKKQNHPKICNVGDGSH